MCVCVQPINQPTSGGRPTARNNNKRKNKPTGKQLNNSTSEPVNRPQQKRKQRRKRLKPLLLAAGAAPQRCATWRNIYFQFPVSARLPACLSVGLVPASHFVGGGESTKNNNIIDTTIIFLYNSNKCMHAFTSPRNRVLLLGTTGKTNASEREREREGKRINRGRADGTEGVVVDLPRRSSSDPLKDTHRKKKTD